MEKDQMTNKIFSISCQSEPGVLPRVIQLFTRPGFKVQTLSQARTDVSEIILITLQAMIPAAAVDNMASRLQKIIGVLAVTVDFGSVLNAAIFRMTGSSAGLTFWDILNRFNARVFRQHSDGQILIHQFGELSDIQRLYNELDGPLLVGFSVLPLAISQPLDWEDIKQGEWAPEKEISV